MLTRDQKEKLVEEISEKIKESTTTVVCDYKGVTVPEMQEVRKKLRESNARMQVLKKTLTKLAYEKAGIELDVTAMEGQSALVFGGDDEVTAPKVLAGVAKENENFKILAGTLENSVMNEQEIMALAKLPGKEELLGMVVGTINAPISSFVQVMAGNLRNLVGVLNAVKETKE